MVLVFFTCHLMKVKFSVTFHEISRTDFKLQNGREFRTETTMHAVKRVMTPKLGKPQLWFLFFARCLRVLKDTIFFQLDYPVMISPDIRFGYQSVHQRFILSK